MKKEYFYEGPVMSFKTCVSKRWQGSTYASSAKKARNNLVFQYKTRHNMLPNAAITLPGKLTTIEGDV